MAYTDEQKAEAAALLAEGRSYRDVEKATGIDHVTVFRWRRDDETFRNAVKAATVGLEDICRALVEKSGAMLLTALDEEEVSVADLNRVMGTAADKLVALKRIETPQKVEHSGSIAVTPEELLERRRRLVARLNPDVIDISDRRTG